MESSIILAFSLFVKIYTAATRVLLDLYFFLLLFLYTEYRIQNKGQRHIGSVFKLENVLAKIILVFLVGFEFLWPVLHGYGYVHSHG